MMLRSKFINFLPSIMSIFDLRTPIQAIQMTLEFRMITGASLYGDDTCLHDELLIWQMLR